MMKVRSKMSHLLHLGNGKSRLRRSLAACALDFILICTCCILCFILHTGSLLRPNHTSHSQDLPRTFPGHPALDENGRNSLRRLLLAYARHNPEVGYCEAMNFFAGLLLLLMPEENAFWAFAGIIDEYFAGYYTEDMIESQVDQLIFEELMRERFYQTDGNSLNVDSEVDSLPHLQEQDWSCTKPKV
ncbi:hypothetical protein GLYMA_13G135700v4 [Glycine max]|nr:hypothetical protein GLYMA_13G135700v4 [Glycine max]KAH1101357.1 hypothetical protein GYH30_036104 [Glycine max]